ncbi:hypothetical protein V8E53_010436 [Lactarius tabidus]
MELGTFLHECPYVAIFFLHRLGRALFNTLRTRHGGDIDSLSRTLETCRQQFPHLIRLALYLAHRFTRYGFQPIAILHSLPQALFVWSTVLNNISLYRIASTHTMTPASNFFFVAILVTTFVSVARAVGRGLSYTCARHLQGRRSPRA